MKKTEICQIVTTQIDNFFSYKIDLLPYIDIALKRMQVCLKENVGKYILNNDDEIGVSIYNSVQNCVFLYFLANTAYKIDQSGINAEKIYYLNKVLNTVDIFYEVDMPDVFFVEHPLGSIMGRANYSNRFFFYQGCTVGGSNGHYPKLGENVLMYSNSKILGNSTIGNNVVLSANAYVIDADIPENCIVFGQSPNHIIRKKKKSEMIAMTKHIWR